MSRKRSKLSERRRLDALARKQTALKCTVSVFQWARCVLKIAFVSAAITIASAKV